MSGRWFRVYAEMVDDPKVQRLPGDAFKALVNLWCLASQNEGRLPSLEDIAFKLRMDEAAVTAMLTDFRRRGLLDDDETGSHPHNWNGRQYASDVSTERVKRHRERQRNVSPPVAQSVSETPPDTDTDTEAERKKERGGAVAQKAVPATEYAFRGDVIRVTDKNLAEWRRAYPLVPNILAELQNADAYYLDHPPKDGKWFFAASNWLKRENDRAAAKRQAEDDVYRGVQVG